MSSAVTTTAASTRVKPFQATVLDAALRIPRWAGLALGAIAAIGPVIAVASRGQPLRVRVLRAILGASGGAYALSMAFDAAEHFRLEREVTGRYLRWKAVSAGESVLHGALLLSVFAAIATARRPPRRHLRGSDHIMLFAPAAFLLLGWLDELVYHRRRASLREEVIHATEHLSEGMMWTALYALRVLAR
jgi:hypothetical protein